MVTYSSYRVELEFHECQTADLCPWHIWRQMSVIPSQHSGGGHWRIRIEAITGCTDPLSIKICYWKALASKVIASEINL